MCTLQTRRAALVQVVDRAGGASCIIARINRRRASQQSHRLSGAAVICERTEFGIAAQEGRTGTRAIHHKVSDVCADRTGIDTISTHWRIGDDRIGIIQCARHVIDTAADARVAGTISRKGIIYECHVAGSVVRVAKETSA